MSAMPRIAAPWSAAWLLVAALLQTTDAVGASAASTAAEPTSVPASAAPSLTDAVVRIAASERLQGATLSWLIQPDAQREFGLRIEALQAELNQTRQRRLNDSHAHWSWIVNREKVR